MPLSPSELKKRFTKSSGWVSTDKVLDRLGRMAQIGLFLLAIFGYFYTVVPVYQKQVLDEAIAEKTLDLAHKTKALKDASAKLAELEGQFKFAQAELLSINKRYSAAYEKLRFQSLLSLRSTLANACSPASLKAAQTFVANELEKCFDSHIASNYDVEALNADDRAAVTKVVGTLKKSVGKKLSAMVGESNENHKKLLAEQEKIRAEFKRANEMKVPPEIAANIPAEVTRWDQVTDPKALRWYIDHIHARAQLVDDLSRIDRRVLVSEIGARGKLSDAVDAIVSEAFKPLLGI